MNKEFAATEQAQSLSDAITRDAAQLLQMYGTGAVQLPIKGTDQYVIAGTLDAIARAVPDGAHLASQSQAAQPSNSREILTAVTSTDRYQEIARRIRAAAENKWNDVFTIEMAELIEYVAHLSGQSQAPAQQAVRVPDADRTKLRDEALSAARYFADCNYEDAHNRGRGGPGVEAKVERAEVRLEAAVNALAAPTVQEASQDAVQSTPANRWAGNGESDPHDDRYDCERAALAMGDLTDDELANAVFMHGNKTPNIQDVIAGRAKMPIVYLAAAKDRIRWLSRALTKAQQATTGSTSSAPAESAAFRALNAKLAAFRAGLEPYRYDSDEEAIAKVRDPVRADVERRASGNAAQEVTQQAAPDEVRQCVRDAVAGALSGLYYCGRVWSAWGVGTMSQDDFSPADEDDDIIENLTDAAMNAMVLANVTQQAAPTEAPIHPAIAKLKAECDEVTRALKPYESPPEAPALQQAAKAETAEQAEGEQANHNSALRAEPIGQHIAELECAADYLEQYAKYCYEVKQEDIERHPYIPSIEEAAEDLRAMIAKARVNAATRCRAEGGGTKEGNSSDLAPTTSTVSAPTGRQYIPANFTTHRAAWREALTFVRDASMGDGAAYWQHELNAYDRAFARLLDNPEPVKAEGTVSAPEEVRNAILEEAAIACFCAVANRRPVYAKDCVELIRALKRTTSGKGEAA